MYYETPELIPNINMYINIIMFFYYKIYKENIRRRVMPAYTYIRMTELHILEMNFQRYISFCII